MCLLCWCDEILISIFGRQTGERKKRAKGVGKGACMFLSVSDGPASVDLCCMHISLPSCHVISLPSTYPHLSYLTSLKPFSHTWLSVIQTQVTLTLIFLATWCMRLGFSFYAVVDKCEWIPGDMCFLSWCYCLSYSPKRRFLVRWAFK